MILSAWKSVIIAYEPVWAIGTGQTAEPQEAQKMHCFIREKLAAWGGSALADDIPLLYGGSCRADTIGALLLQPDIDGALVGGASLQLSLWEPLINHAVACYADRT